MDVYVTVNMHDTDLVFSISFLIFCFSILFLTSKYLSIYYITKYDSSLLDELEDIYILYIYITPMLSIGVGSAQPFDRASLHHPDPTQEPHPATDRKSRLLYKPYPNHVGPHHTHTSPTLPRTAAT
jgi:hypothetical protein